jgi:hypothetical protein
MHARRDLNAAGATIAATTSKPSRAAPCHLACQTATVPQRRCARVARCAKHGTTRWVDASMQLVAPERNAFVVTPATIPPRTSAANTRTSTRRSPRTMPRAARPGTNSRLAGAQQVRIAAAPSIPCAVATVPPATRIHGSTRAKRKPSTSTEICKHPRRSWPDK